MGVPSMKTTITCAALLGALWMTAAPAGAMEARIYAYPSAENYCPAGLQPVTIDGAISCGVPNQPVSYQAMKAHPVQTRAARRVYAGDCPVGVKGCR